MTCIRSKASYSTSPKWPCPGSQNASRAICAGERGNSVFDQRRPRSRTPTERPAWASRQAVTLPPNPEPTTTTSYDARTAASPRPLPSTTTRDRLEACCKWYNEQEAYRRLEPFSTNGEYVERPRPQQE